MFLMSSCTGEPGEPGRDGLGILQTVLISVPQSHWQYSGLADNNFFYAEVEMPEINGTVFDKGVVKMYRAINFYESNASQIELPYVRHKEYLANEEDGTWGFYTETIDYEYQVGKIYVYYTASDFDYEIDGGYFCPEEMQFRCVIMY